MSFNNGDPLDGKAVNNLPNLRDSREDAVKAGSIKYLSAGNCVNNHMMATGYTVRYANSGHCIECVKDLNRKRLEKAFAAEKVGFTKRVEVDHMRDKINDEEEIMGYDDYE